MPRYAVCREARVDAPPQACFDALVDYDALPSWQGAVREATVVERDEAGRGRVIDYEVDAKVARVRYRLEQHYEEPTRIVSRYLGGDFAAMDGEWRFSPLGDGATCAVFELAIDPGRLVPRPVRRMLSEAVVRGALADLQRHLGAARA
jgi:ribosome-associated toxin RatA of RatAB toxin-antitoxin module